MRLSSPVANLDLCSGKRVIHPWEFDRVIAAAVTMFVDRPRAGAELRVSARRAGWSSPPSSLPSDRLPARVEASRGQLCLGMQVDQLEPGASHWGRPYALSRHRQASMSPDGPGGSKRGGVRVMMSRARDRRDRVEVR